MHEMDYIAWKSKQMFKSFGIAICVMLTLGVKAQITENNVERDREGKGFRVLSYNVENLFDTIADGSNNDEEFLPNSSKNYNTIKYRHKISNLAKAIRATGGWIAPEIVGLIEVENRAVLIDLAQHPSLKKANYGIVHFDSPDPRGIDVALLFDTTLAEVLHSEPIAINEQRMRTRDILFVKLVIKESDTLHVFVNHWSSRRGGKEQSSYKREIAAKILKNHTDSILRKDERANILVMGDFNDGPQDASVKILTDAAENPLVNLLSEVDPIIGTYKYRGVWDVIDQIIVSSAMVNNAKGMFVINNEVVIFNDEFLLVEDDKYGDFYPKRCWKGDFYNGGFSDHLPVFVDIAFNK